MSLGAFSIGSGSLGGLEMDVSVFVGVDPETIPDVELAPPIDRRVQLPVPSAFYGGRQPVEFPRARVRIVQPVKKS